MKTQKVIIIDAEKREVREGVVKGLKDQQTIVGGLICLAGDFSTKGDELFVNDEGLLTNPQFFFYLAGMPQPYAGNGYLIGECDRNGYSTNVKIDIRYVRDNVKCMTPLDVTLWAKSHQGA